MPNIISAFMVDTSMIEFQSEHLIICAVVMVLMALDYGSGVLAAIKNKNFKSSKMREGLWHKAGICLLLIVCWILNLHYEGLGLPSTFGSILPLAHTAIAFMEIASIAENCAKINPELRKLAFWKMFERKDEEKKEKK